MRSSVETQTNSNEVDRETQTESPYLPEESTQTEGFESPFYQTQTESP
jgi:hypothetical protein